MEERCPANLQDSAPPPEVEEACRRIMQVVGARQCFFPAAAPDPGQEPPPCLSKRRAESNIAVLAGPCDCGRSWWEALALDLPSPFHRVLFCGLPPDAPPHLLDFCQEALVHVTQNLHLRRQTARNHHLWNRFAGQTDLNHLAEEAFTALGERLPLREAAFLVEDDDGWLVPVAGHRIRWSASQAAGLRVPTRRYREDLHRLEGLFCPEPSDPLVEWWTRLYLTRHDGSVLRGADCRCLPIVHQNRLIGMVITTLAPQTASHDPDELAVMQKAIAAGLQNSLVFQSMQKFTTALATIHTIHRLMHTAESPDFLVRSIGQLACEMLQVRKCAIMLVSEDGTMLAPVAQIGLTPGEVGSFPAHRSDGIPGWIWVNRDSLLIDNLAEDSRFQDEPASRYPEQYYLGLPLSDGDFVGVILVSGKDRPFRTSERDLLVVLAEQTAIALSNARLIERQRLTIRRTLETMAEVLEGGSDELAGLTREVVEWACRLRDHGYTEGVDRESLVYACLLRDAARLRAPETVTPLSAEEMTSQNRSHPQIALRIIRELGLPEAVSQYVLAHHEAWDGSGYPEGLVGEAIPLGARILAVAEAFVVLTHGRRGRPPMAPRQTLRLMTRLSGRMFDPRLVAGLHELAATPPPQA